jgi:regulator of cell morphogenesis and NO signaling
MTLLELVDFLQKEHHYDTRHKLAQLNHSLQLLLRGNCETKLDLLQVYQNFNGFRMMFEQHLNKEEQVLFPFIRDAWKVAQSEKTNLLPQDTLFISPLRLFRAEHLSLLAQMKQVREVLNSLRAEENESLPLQKLKKSVSALEHKLNEHITLENNLLYPCLLRLGKEIKGRAERAKQAKLVA